MQKIVPDDEVTVLHLHMNVTEAQKSAIFAAAEEDERSVTMWARFHLLRVIEELKAEEEEEGNNGDQNA